MKRTWHFIVPALVATLLGAAACASSHGARPPLSAPTSTTRCTSSTTTLLGPGARAELQHVYVTTALGDSVPYGTACECTPYPQLIGSAISDLVGHKVETRNDAVPGFKSADVLHQLQHDKKVMHDVEDADVVMVEVGANDVAHSSTCGTEVACYEPQTPDTTRNLMEIVQRIHALAGNVAVAMLDYWNVWLGGQYAVAQGPDYVDAADALTTQVNQAIRSIAHGSGSIYVDLRSAFRGPEHDEDETDLLAPDGDHPNAAGHQRIAEAIAAAIAQ